MTLKLEVGKYYRTRDGRKVGPMQYLLQGLGGENGEDYPWTNSFYTWTNQGRQGFNSKYETPNDLVAEWKEETPRTNNEEYKPWKDLTNEEKGTLLLAHHDGKVIEVYRADWVELEYPGWNSHQVYRIKPGPVVETRNLYIYTKDTDYHTTKVGTIRLIDGKPDVNSIKMEEL